LAAGGIRNENRASRREAAYNEDMVEYLFDRIGKPGILDTVMYIFYVDI
jgi:hypothetical protein